MPKIKDLNQEQKLQLIGLCTIGRSLKNDLNSIEKSFLNILKNPYLGEDMFWDIIYGSNPISEELESILKTKLHVKDPLKKSKK